MKLINYLKDLKNKITGNDVYLVSSEKMGFKSEEELTENTNIEKELTEEEELALLESATKNFFPESGCWYSTCFKRPKEHVIGYAPCNLRDYDWLAHTLQKKENLFNIDYQKILNFVKTSELFEKERHAYEQRVVAWQINWMVNGGEGWISDEEYGGDFILWDQDCDIGFRKGIVDTLTAIGMNHKAIEEGIEKNAHLWRDLFMKRAFSNRFEDLFLDLDPIDEEHEEMWLKLRKYEYYQRHKKSVELYSPRNYSSDNIYSPAIIELTKAEENYEELKVILEQKNNDRLEHMRKCKNDPTKKRTLHLL